MEKKIVIIDIACLRGMEGTLVVKEFAAVSVGSAGGEAKSIQSFMFQPPYPEWAISKETRRTNNWVTANLHGIRWSHGHIPYTELKNILLETVIDYDKIYTKGLEKAEFLTDLIGTKVHDLDKLECPRADKIITPINTRCAFRHFRDCALNKCLKYAYWMTLRIRFAIA